MDAAVPVTKETSPPRTYSALRKYSAPLNFATFCHISGFKHKDIKLYFFWNDIHWIFQTFLTNQKLENWACKIIQLFCKEEWEKISVSRCAKLIEAYPKRLTAVIAAKGGAAKY
ncbi:unnamed protein product [Oncorhynchus mykiss]|uniref:Uncharacterized protein n=1 Tax=Oncorhynchus mykiss TaxID=8022 RepID=A0A060YP98_ONCMY|nr:unnamed protein product [Oncorhynchus mykiss]